VKLSPIVSLSMTVPFTFKLTLVEFQNNLNKHGRE